MSLIGRVLMDVTNAYTGLNMSLATRLSAQRTQMSDLVEQETTGLKAKTYAGVDNRTLTLSFQSKLAENEAYQNTIAGIDTRLGLVTNAYEALMTTSSSLSGSLDQNVFNLTSTGQTPQQTAAVQSLDTYVSTLNMEYGGLYVFGGTATDAPPVVSTDTIMNGDATHAGFETVAAQRLQADLGANAMGRLGTTLTGSTVSLAEDGAHVFGMKLTGVSSTLANATVTDGTSSAGGAAPHSLAVAFTGQPAEGETLKLTLTQPDGTTSTITLTAGTTNATDGTTFAIGATAADTAANLKAALETQLKETAATETTAASTVAAANDFFDTTGGGSPMRVAGPPYDSATSLVAGTSANTVIWYTGTNDANAARADASARIDTDLTVQYGTRANESAIVTQIKQMAVLATIDVSSGSDTAKKLYAAVIDRTKSILSSTTGAHSLQAMETEIAGAQKAGQLASTRLKTASETYQTAVDKAINADTTEVAVQLAAMQTQIQASYKATALLYKMSLTDYL